MRGGLLRATLAFVGALPWCSGLAAPLVPVSLKRAIELTFGALCHHDPARTLVIHAEAMCVCSRCAGVYAGIALAALCSWSRSPRTGARVPRIVLGIGAALIIVDALTQDLGMHAPWHPARIVSGALVGGAAAAWMLTSLSGSPRGSRALIAPPP